MTRGPWDDATCAAFGYGVATVYVVAGIILAIVYAEEIRAYLGRKFGGSK